MTENKRFPRVTLRMALPKGSIAQQYVWVTEFQYSEAKND